MNEINQILGTGLKPIKSKMNFRVVTMTPEVAAELLKRNHPRNRKKKDNRINLYYNEILNDLWKLTHQPVAIDEDGYLIDGQNRLEAIVMADIEVPLVLVTGVPKEAMLAADQGCLRNVMDLARVTGFNVEQPTGWPAVARMMARGAGKTRNFMSTQMTLAYMKAHRKALEFAWECLPENKRGLTMAGVRAAIARSYYQRDSHNRIKAFCKVLYTGLPNHVEHDSAAIRLRNWLLDAALNRRAGVMLTMWTVYAKTEKALLSFINKEKVDRLWETSKELFLIPGDPKETSEDEAKD